MLRLCLKLLLALPMLAALNLFAVGLGRAQPENPALAGLGECERLCWSGIEPGLTSRDSALQIVRKAGFTETSFRQLNYIMFENAGASASLCRIAMTFKQGIVIALYLEFCPAVNVQVGQIVARLGVPQRIMAAGRELAGYETVYGGLGLGLFGWWSPFDRVTRLSLQPISAGRLSSGWRGFVPVWRYCQLEPAYLGCR